jgi:hypothetical protein
MSFNGWDSAAAGNASIGGIIWAEGMLPSGVNNSSRQMMADVAEVRDGTAVATGWHVKANGLVVHDQTDTTKKVIFDVSSVSAGSTRTIGFQNKAGTIALTGDTPSDNTVPNSALAQMAANTIKGNNTGATANAADLTASQVAALLATVGGILNSKIVSFTRDLSTASGTQAVTGVGFQPTSILLFASAAGTGIATDFVSVSGADSAKTSVAIVSGVGAVGVFQLLDTAIIRLFTDTTTSNIATATLSSYDSDGFTLSWTKTGSPTGTARLIALCFR